MLPDRRRVPPGAVVDVTRRSGRAGRRPGHRRPQGGGGLGTGRVVAHAFEPVDLVLPRRWGRAGPGQWWSAVAAAARRALADSGVPPEQVVGVGCTAQWLGTVAVGGDGRAAGPTPSSGWTRGAPRPCGGRVRGPVNVFGYASGKAARWIHRPGASPACLARTRWATSSICGTSDPTSTGRQRLPRAGRLPEPRLTGLARASSTRSPCTGSPTTAASTGWPTTPSCWPWPGWTGPPCPSWSPPAPSWPACRRGGRRAGPPARHAGGRRDRRPAVGGRGLGGGGRLRRPPLHRHLFVDQLPRALQEDVGPHQHHRHPLWPARALPGGRRARDRRGLSHLAAGPALSPPTAWTTPEWGRARPADAC